MADIREGRIDQAIILVGSGLVLLDGAGTESYFSVVQDGATGAIMNGIKGDAAAVTGITRNGYTATLTFIGMSMSVTTLLKLAKTGSLFAINMEYGDWSIIGAGVLIDKGAWEASAAGGERTMVVGIIRSSGNTDSAVGETFAA